MMEDSAETFMEEFSKITCMAHSKKMSNRFYQIFAIRGTGLFCKIETYDYLNKVSIPKISWMIKLKKYQLSRGAGKFASITFEQVLDHPRLGDKAREELLFHLNIFASRESKK